MPDAGTGLFKGFEGYQTTQDEDLSAVLSGGIVALDTNVLLDLYRFGAGARQEFLGVLERLADRLFVPHQVMLEFWRNRVTVLEDVGAAGTEVELRKARNAALAIIDRWRARTRSNDEASAISSDLERLYDEVESRVRRVEGQLDAAEAVADTGRDPVLEVLAVVLEGSVGQPFEDTRREELIAEGRHRFAQEIPPGYLDADKQRQGEEGTGDYLVWEQLVSHAQETGLDVLLVTRDSKPDWWRVDRRHRLLGPRVELVAEFQGRTSQRFMMVRPQVLLEVAERLLDVPVSASTIQDANRLSELSEDSEEATWDEASLRTLLQRLRQSGHETQAAVIDEASRTTGSVSRNRIYQIGQIDPSRKLTGFTKPVIRAVDALVEEGTLPAGLEYPLVADFADGPGRATSFSLPATAITAATSSQRQPAWVQAAEAVMEGSEDWWTVADLVDQISRRGLHDVGSAMTPNDKLRRDMHGAGDLFEENDEGLFRRRLATGRLE